MFNVDSSHKDSFILAGLTHVDIVITAVQLLQKKFGTIQMSVPNLVVYNSLSY